MALVPDLAGRRVLVTGASTGIGAAVAMAFGECGAAVGVHYHTSREAAREVAAGVERAGGRAVLLAADVRKPGRVEALVAESVEALGGLDVLVNNAGGMVRRAPLEEVSEALLDEVLDLNVRPVIVACRTAAAHLPRAGGGAIINTGSTIAGRHGGAVGSLLYGGAKAFVHSLTRNLAKEFAPYGIRVNAVSPGNIATPFHEKYTPPALLEAHLREIPMGRIGSPEECAGVYLFLASERLSGYVTGQVIEVNGGQLMP